MPKSSYLCIGHVTQDITPSGVSLGGTVIYSSLTARILGKQPAIVTSCGPQLDWSDFPADIPAIRTPSLKTTTFENIYGSSGRRQSIHAVAEPITLDDIPEEWRSASVIHLGPVANEVDPEMIYHLKGTVIGLTPQGWHRGWDSRGNIFYIPWPPARDILPEASAVIVSREDILDGDMWELYRKYCRILVITAGQEGCLVRFRNRERHFTAPQIEEVDPTGVGDIFAAAYFVNLLETDGDPWESARLATQLAAPTVTRRGLAGIPEVSEIKALFNRQKINDEGTRPSWSVKKN